MSHPDEHGGKMVVFKRRKQLLLRVPTFKTEYYFHHQGPNNEPICQSEGYASKQSIKSLHERYYSAFEWVDETGEV